MRTDRNGHSGARSVRALAGLWLGLAGLLAGAAAQAQPHAVPAGSRYVAMGSSFASGPGVTTSADTPPTRCQRSIDNYAHQLARKRGLDLVDVSCGGATTANVLGRWNELPPQVDALTPDTRLVTVTIGGNDLGYLAKLLASSCAGDSANGKAADKPALCRYFAGGAASPAHGVLAPPDAAAWAKVEEGLTQIAAEVRKRSPAARLIFVDYPVVLPDGPLCAQTPLPPEAAAQARALAARLAELTASVAKRTGAEVVQASVISRGHDVCAAEPWMAGFSPPPGATGFTPYHPNLAGMTAVAEALDRQLR